MYALPSSRMPHAGVATWGDAGIPGSIPDTSSWPIYNVAGADPTGVLDSSSAIQATIDSAKSTNPEGAIVLLPAGNFRINTTLSITNPNNFNSQQDNISILFKGAGKDQTIINGYQTTGSIISISSGSGEQGFYSISETLARGDTTATLSSMVGMDVGAYVTIRRANATSAEFPGDVPAYMTNTRSQIVRITGVNGSVITFSPALNEGGAGDSLVFSWNQAINCGIEDLTVDNVGGSGTHNIDITTGYECWVKNVESRDAVKWHIRLKQSAHCELRNNYVHEGPSGGGDSIYGYGVFQYSCDNLIENNIAWRTRHAFIIEWGGMNNVFGYNYSFEPINQGQQETDFQMGDISTHGGEPSYNLWEGNVAAMVKWDNVLGGNLKNTAFRNQLTRKSIDPHTIYGSHAVDLQAHTRDASIIGNVTEQEGAWDASPQSEFRYNTDDGGNVTDDPDTVTTTLIHGHYSLTDDATTWIPATDQDLPDSLYLTAKPSWWDGGVWPAIGPALPDRFGENPAYRRYHEVLSDNVLKSFKSCFLAIIL